MRHANRPAFLALLLLGGCSADNCGDDEARLEAAPEQALQMATAIGASFSLAIFDACVGGGLAPCTTEQASELLDVSQTEELFEITDSQQNRIELAAFSIGTTRLSLTARFEGEAEGVRTASRDFDIREPDRVRLTPSCEVLESTEPWLVPVNVATAVELVLQGQGADLFHDDVDWYNDVRVDATGLEFTSGQSPETTELVFVAPGIQQAEMTSVGSGDEFLIYEPRDLDALDADLPSETISAGSFVSFTPRAHLEGRPVCISDPNETVVARVVEGPCAFSSFDAADVERNNDLGSGFQVYGLAAGVCNISTWVIGTDLEDFSELTVLENESDNAPR